MRFMWLHKANFNKYNAFPDRSKQLETHHLEREAGKRTGTGEAEGKILHNTYT